MDNKNIEIVSGDGSNLDISPVYEHISAGKPNSDKPKNIIVPKEGRKAKKVEHKNKEIDADDSSDNK